MQTMGVRAALLGAVMLVGLCGAANADAGAERLSGQFSQCRQMARGAVEHSACLADEAQRQDDRLNQLYRQLQASLQGKPRSRLVAAQRVWLISRERDGALDSALGEAGQIGNLQGGLDDLLRVAARADQLQTWLDRLE